MQPFVIITAAKENYSVDLNKSKMDELRTLLLDSGADFDGVTLGKIPAFLVLTKQPKSFIATAKLFNQTNFIYCNKDGKGTLISAEDGKKIELGKLFSCNDETDSLELSISVQDGSKTKKWRFQ